MRRKRTRVSVLRFMSTVAVSCVTDDVRRYGRSSLSLLAGGVVALALAGCAQQPQQQSGQRTSEYFPASKYGPASARVVADGQPVPRGGGKYLVGRPYSIAGKRYRPGEMAVGQTQVGKASWYGSAFHGRRTANGEIYDMAAFTAAHPTMPLPSYARVTNVDNGRSIIVRVNDRGPYHGGRVMDLSSRAADALDYKRSGTASVKVDYLGAASLAGSDDAKLLATLRTDGKPATLDGFGGPSPVMVAEEAPRPSFTQRVAQLQTTTVAASQPAPAPVQPAAAAVAPQLASLKPAQMPAKVPLPPSRPFDLGTIPGAGVPIAPSPRLRQAFATFYAPPTDGITTLLEKQGMFSAVDRLEQGRAFSRR